MRAQGQSIQRSDRRRASARTVEPAGGRSQRERLIDAVIALAAKGGTQALSVAQISAEAGVSSATFYAQFENKEDCILSAYRAAAEHLLVTELPRATDGDWASAAGGTLRRLGLAINENPAAGRLLFLDPLAPGERLREARAAAVNAFERRVHEFIDSVPSDGCVIDVPPIALVGAVRSIVARYLRTHSESKLPELADEGVRWVLCYAVAPGRRRWSTGPGALLDSAAVPTQAPRRRSQRARLPRGRHGLPPGVVARSHRMRIIYGTAEVVQRKGYANSTVANIVAAAGVSREVFYEHFSDKQHAFLEAQNHPTQHILDTCANAYFSAEDWPQRVWRALEALLGLIAESPALSHLRLVECYAAGPEAIRRAEEITRSFTIFLEEGFRHSASAQQLPKLCPQAIAGAAFEIIQRRAARHELDVLPRLLPRLTYLCIAPFLGAEGAIDFLKQQIRATREELR